MRLFFAVDFSPATKDAIEEATRRATRAKPTWRWVGRENLHITIKFLGETDEDRLSGLIACAEKVGAAVRPFELEFGGLDGFPHLARPRVLFYRVVSGAVELRALAEHLDQSLHAELSIPREDRAFRAHATVARLKSPVPPALLGEIAKAPAPAVARERVERFVLMRSELRREGAKYDCLKEFALAGGG